MNDETKLLISLVDLRELFHDDDQTFAGVLARGHRETLDLGSASFEHWLRSRCYEATNSAPKRSNLRDAIDQLKARAQFEGPQIRTAYRLASSATGGIVIDLGDAGWHCVAIETSGWTITSHPDEPRFIRRPGMGELPLPEHGGDIDDLRSFVNVATDDDMHLLLADIVMAMQARGPYPVINLVGPQGSAKTSTTRVMVDLLDPGKGRLNSPPKKVDDVMINASHGRVLVMENVSKLSDALSDALCRVSTGTGHRKRKLFTDDDEIMLEACAPVVMNGIPEVIMRADLADRALVLRLPELAATEPEAEFRARFERAKPRIYGALCSAVSDVLRSAPDTTLDHPPRMADFARVGVTMERVLGWPTGSFLRAYEANRLDATLAVLESDEVAMALQAFMTTRGFWSGSTEELLQLLRSIVGDRPAPGFPRMPRGLTERLKRLAPDLRKIGLDVDWADAGHHLRNVVIRRLGSHGGASQQVVEVEALDEQTYD